jgi:hypothetical protein
VRASRSPIGAHRTVHNHSSGPRAHCGSHVTLRTPLRGYHNQVSEPWLCESLRLSALWHLPTGAESALSWEAVVGLPPETSESQPRQGTNRSTGPVKGDTAILELRTAPGRADWLLVPVIGPGSLDQPTFPNIGPVDEVLRFFDGLLFSKAAGAYPAPRFGLGVTGLHMAADRDASYAELTSLLKTISPKLEGAVEFLYQINRPRQSTVVAGLMINRLSRWSSIAFGGVRLAFAMPSSGKESPLPQSIKPLNATRVDLDINSTVDRHEPVPAAQREALLRELARLGPEILRSGDTP